MYSRCVHCLAALGSNELLSTFPVGRRIAFDSAGGRLWVICRSCDRWNLTPLEERWEAAEECERAFSSLLTRYSTQNIALAQVAEGTELIRIGSPPRTEFAAWRYGRCLSTRAERRRRRHRVLYGAVAALGVATALGLPGGAAAAAAVGLGIIGLRGGPGVDVSHLGVLPRDGTVRIRRDESFVSAYIRVSHDSRLGWELSLVTEGREGGGEGGPWYRYQLVDGDALKAITRILPVVNDRGGSDSEVAHAIQELERVKRPGDYYLLAPSRIDVLRAQTPLTWDTPQPPLEETSLANLPVVLRLALEIALHEETESQALSGELKELEERWKEAEIIASIADGLLVPPAVEQHLEHLRSQQRS